MFDPTLPQAGTDIDAVQMRAQLNGLKDLIDAVPTITSAVIDSVTTVNPGQPAGVTAAVASGVLHFSFAIPQGATGPQGSDGLQGPAGDPGPPGPPGEVTWTDLNIAIAGTASNCNSVSVPSFIVSDPPTQSEVSDIANTLLVLIQTLQR